jgi:benzoate 4-monooxygenase
MILSFLFSPYAILLIPVLYYLVPYLQRSSIRKIPGPTLAAFSNLWLLYQCRQGKRYLAVDEAHKKYGPLVRLQPHHVSIVDTEAIYAIYGHGNGYLKSEYYDAFVSIRRGLFNTRDRAEHTRKRKIISHTFSAKSVGQFEQYMVRRGTRLCLNAEWMLSVLIWSSFSNAGQKSRIREQLNMQTSMHSIGSTFWHLT